MSPEKKVNLDEDTLAIVEKSCYLGDVVSWKSNDSVVFSVE